ncbi:MAG: PAS domain S-box protein [Planctomycetota bacterium]
MLRKVLAMQKRNWMSSPQATANFGLIMVVLVLDGIVVHRNATALQATQDSVVHTQEVLVQVETLFSTLKDAESNARGYVITGNASHLTAYKSAAAAVPTLAQDLANLVSDNIPQIEQLQELRRRLEARLTHLEAVVAARTEEGFDAGREQVVSGGGLTKMGAVREVIDQLKAEEYRLLAIRSREAESRRSTVLTANFVGVCLAVIVTAVAWYLIEKELGKRRRAEEAVRAGRQNLLVTLNSIADAVIVTDVAGRVKIVNPVAQQLIGNRGELIGRLLPDIFPVVTAATREPVENPVTRVLEAGKVVGLSSHTLSLWPDGTLLVRPDGTEIPIEHSAAPIRDQSGHMTGVVLVFRDCTERKRFEEASIERERRFRRVFETPLIGIAVGNSAGYLIEANDAYLDLIGYQRGELDEARLSWGGVPAGQSPLSESAHFELLEKGVCKPFERTYFNAAGKEIPVLVSAARLLDQQDQIVVYVTDLTQAKRVEVALRDSESRFRVLSECMPQKVWIARPDGQVDYVNNMLVEYAGVPAEQLTGWGWQELIHPDDTQRHMEIWKQAVAAGEMFVFEHRLHNRSGEYRWHLARALPIYAPNTQVAMWVGTNTDIHDHKLAEETLREEHRRKDQFLALLAHELRNPLAPLSNAVQIFSAAQNDPALSAKLLAIMQRQLRQMTRLIDDLLDLARITQGRILLRRDRTAVQAVVAAAVEAIQPLITDRQHQLTVTLPHEELWLDADAARLAQILTNLLNNAAKYTNPHGQIDLIVERNEGDILFRVRDNGPGISPEMLPKIFDLFMQAEQTLDRAHGGLGIGLTLVRNLVELHGGKVTATSEGTGKGSEFVVRLPLPNEALSSATGSTTASPEAPQPLPTLRVLVVDDVQASAQTLVLMLGALDQDAEAVFDGRTAITRMTQEHFDVVFLDIAMPGMDGLEVARELRTHSELDSVTLVALTGFGQEEDRRRSMEAGFDEHLVKPTSLDLLREILQHAASDG